MTFMDGLMFGLGLCSAATPFLILWAFIGAVMSQ